MRLKRFLAVFCLITVFVIPGLAMAAGGDGSGGGGGGDNPLTLDGAYLCSVNGNTSTTDSSVSGVSNIPLNPTIKLVFTLNVVDDSVWPAPNRSAVSMHSGSGNTVPVEVFRIDPSVNREERHNIFIRPSGSLQTGEQYTITAGPSLKGKNGNTLGESTGGQGTSVSFTTEGTSASAQGSVVSQQSTSSQQGASGVVPRKKMSSGSFSTKQTPIKFRPPGRQKSVSVGNSGGSSLLWRAAALAAAALSLIFAIEVYMRFKHKQKVQA